MGGRGDYQREQSHGRSLGYCVVTGWRILGCHQFRRKGEIVGSENTRIHSGQRLRNQRQFWNVCCDSKSWKCLLHLANSICRVQMVVSLLQVIRMGAYTSLTTIRGGSYILCQVGHSLHHMSPTYSHRTSESDQSCSILACNILACSCWRLSSHWSL